MALYYKTVIAQAEDRASNMSGSKAGFKMLFVLCEFVFLIVRVY